MSFENSKIQEVVSVFLRAKDGSFLMQLRDNIPSIVFPGNWGLFGGAIENGESARAAVCRELEEEIELNVVPKEIYEFRHYLQSNYSVHTYCCHLRYSPSKLNLQEGADFGLFPINEILTGRLFSQKFQAYFDVAEPLRGYFLDISKVIR